MQATQKFKVLIVEDDRWSRELMSEWVSLREELELQGLAASALEALDLMREKEASEGQGYDLILLDINLPGMSGLEFLEQVEELPFIIFTTAHEQFAVQAYEIGVLDYLLKPIEQARFDRAIDRFLNIMKDRIPFDMYRIIEEIKGGEKYRKSSLPDGIVDEFVRRILHYMEIDRAYTNEDLTLQKMARDLDIPPHHLSQVLNIKLNKNYYQFINAYRVAEARRLLSLPENRDTPILEISVQAGFKSKSVFNAVFREFTNVTPREYRDAAVRGREDDLPDH